MSAFVDLKPASVTPHDNIWSAPVDVSIVGGAAGLHVADGGASGVHWGEAAYGGIDVVFEPLPAGSALDPANPYVSIVATVAFAGPGGTLSSLAGASSSPGPTFIFGGTDGSIAMGGAPYHGFLSEFPRDSATITEYQQCAPGAGGVLTMDLPLDIFPDSGLDYSDGVTATGVSAARLEGGTQSLTVVYFSDSDEALPAFRITRLVLRVAVVGLVSNLSGGAGGRRARFWRA